MSRKTKEHFSQLITFVLIFGLFISAAYLEFNRSVEIQKRELRDQVSLLQAQIDNQFTKRVQTVRGLIPYIQIEPDLTEAEFMEFAAKLMSQDDKIVRSIAFVEDTTIKYLYPKIGSESAMGVDLTTIEKQRDVVLEVKKTGNMALDGPVEIIEGGIGLISRMPIFLNPESKSPVYYGQINYVSDFNELMKLTGITSIMDEYHLEIVQINNFSNKENIIISNYQDFKNDSIVSTLHLPNAVWKITMEYKNGYNGKSPFYYFLIYTGILISMLYMIYLKNILNSRDELEESFTNLKSTQEQLILSEKLAALGGLTAGVAHEINTPLGVSITLTSHVESKLKRIENKFNTGSLSKSELNNFIKDVEESTDSLMINLTRASELVKSFKMLAADQHSNELRKINIHKYIQDITHTLMPEIKKTSHTLELDIEDIEIYTDPSAITRVITNLVMNSLTHGFENIDAGNIFIKCFTDESKEKVIIEYSDDGLGISDDLKDKIFTPFFSTKRSQGNTGLGLHIIHTAVVKSLGGTIDVSNQLEKGLTFTIVFPITN